MDTRSSMAGIYYMHMVCIHIIRHWFKHSYSGLIIVILPQSPWGKIVVLLWHCMDRWINWLNGGIVKAYNNTHYDKRYHSTIKGMLDNEQVVQYMEIKDCDTILYDGALTCDCYLNFLQKAVRDCYEELFLQNSCHQWFQYNGPLCMKHQMYVRI